MRIDAHTAARLGSTVVCKIKTMQKYSVLFLVALFFGFTSIPEVQLKSDGSLLHHGNNITISELKEYNYSEITLIVDHDVPYGKFINTMAKLKEIGIEKVGVVSNLNGLNEKSVKVPNN